MYRKVIIFCIAMCLGLSASAQKWAVSANAGDFLTFGTLNVSGQFAFSRHFSLDASVRYNPWIFNNGKLNQFNYRHQTYSLGVKYWPWFIYSGFWVSLKGQYQEYSRTLLNFNLGHASEKATTGVDGKKYSQLEQGDAFGGVATLGYTFMITKWFNVDLGVGGWAGYTKYKTYDRSNAARCTTCGRRTDADTKAPASGKMFLLPNELVVSAMFVF